MRSLDRVPKHESAMLACDLAVIPVAVRRRYRELRSHLAEILDSGEETRSGYVFTFRSDLLSESEISDWIDLERRCCPWLSIRIGKILAGAIEVHMSIPEARRRSFALSSRIGCNSTECEEVYRMRKVSFPELPWVVRIVLGVAAFNIWWSFEEFVIDRFGVWRYLPDYKFGQLCVWDLTVAAGISIAIWVLSHQRITDYRGD